MADEIDVFAQRLDAVTVTVGAGLSDIRGDIQTIKDELSQRGVLTHDQRVLLDNSVAKLEALAAAVTALASENPEPAPAPVTEPTA